MLKFIAPFADQSGYGSAARNTLGALYRSGIEVTTVIPKFQPGVNDLSEHEKLAFKLHNRQIEYSKILLELTPDMYKNCWESCKYHIGRPFWEVVGLPAEWVWQCNKIDEVWASCPSFAEIFRQAGIRKPITVIPESIDTIHPPYKSLDIPGHEGFLFYSIFQWQARKNPRGLVTSYWRTFEGRDDVTLLIKTYRANFSEEERQQIQRDIAMWKQVQKQKHYPRLRLILDPLSREDIWRLHATGDCFVSPHHGEGFGRCQMEATVLGKPIISTGFGGIHDYLDDSQAWLIPYQLIPVWGMANMYWYDSSMLWADPRIAIFEEMMWEAYCKPELVREKGKKGQELVCASFNHEIVGQMMRDIL